MIKGSEIFYHIGKFAAGNKLIMVAFCLTITVVLGLGMVDIRLVVSFENKFFFIFPFFSPNLKTYGSIKMGELIKSNRFSKTNLDLFLGLTN